MPTVTPCTMMDKQKLITPSGHVNPWPAWPPLSVRPSCCCQQARQLLGHVWLHPMRLWQTGGPEDKLQSVGPPRQAGHHTSKCRPVKSSKTFDPNWSKCWRANSPYLRRAKAHPEPGATTGEAGEGPSGSGLRSASGHICVPRAAACLPRICVPIPITETAPFPEARNPAGPMPFSCEIPLGERPL